MLHAIDTGQSGKREKTEPRIQAEQLWHGASASHPPAYREQWQLAVNCSCLHLLNVCMWQFLVLSVTVELAQHQLHFTTQERGLRQRQHHKATELARPVYSNHRSTGIWPRARVPQKSHHYNGGKVTYPKDKMPSSSHSSPLLLLPPPPPPLAIATARKLSPHKWL